MQKLYAEFNCYLQQEKQTSKNTAAAYTRDAEAFCVACGISTCTQLLRVSQADLKRYLTSLRDKGRKLATVQRSRASLNALFSMLFQQGKITQNPIKGLTLDSTAKKLPETLTQREVERLLEIKHGNDLKLMRDKAMLELLYATGMKASELILLNIGDVNTKLGVVRCGKQNLPRMLPMYPQAARTLEEYIQGSRKFLVSSPKEQALFVNTSGTRISRQGFWKMIKQHAERAGITKNITPQMLRHSFALHLFENGADLKSVQQMLGHADASSTQIYARMMRSPLQDAYTRFHPKAK